MDCNVTGKGPASTPPMGWNSWNTFYSNISEEVIRSIADAMVDGGYLQGFFSSGDKIKNVMEA